MKAAAGYGSHVPGLNYPEAWIPTHRRRWLFGVLTRHVLNARVAPGHPRPFMVLWEGGWLGHAKVECSASHPFQSLFDDDDLIREETPTP